MLGLVVVLNAFLCCESDSVPRFLVVKVPRPTEATKLLKE
jgi:hypothetical protein